ncbi:MAG: hypothetical protein V4662_10200 [Verrucomicrobiota bacterium]
MPRDRETLPLTLPPLLSSGTDEVLAERLLAAISERVWELPFHSVCTHGGPKTDDKAECSDLRYEHQSPNQLRGSFAYAFTEETNLGCSDQHYTDRVRGRFHFSYDLLTGVLTVDVPQIHAEYDPEDI